MMCVTTTCQKRVETGVRQAELMSDIHKQNKTNGQGKIGVRGEDRMEAENHKHTCKQNIDTRSTLRASSEES